MLALAVALASCASTVVVDRAVYRNQILFFRAAAAGLSRAEVLRARALATAGDVPGCELAAGPALQVDVLVPYQAALALWAVELGPDPGPAPTAPAARDWCATGTVSR